MTLQRAVYHANKEYRRAKRAAKHNGDPTVTRTQFKRAKSAQKLAECHFSEQ